MTTGDKERGASQASTKGRAARSRTTKAGVKPPAGGEKASKPKAAPKRRGSRTKAKPDASPTAARADQALPRLLLQLRSDVSSTLTREFGYTSPMQAPRLEKIVLNVGLGKEALDNARAVDNATGDLARISGQKPVTRRARKSIAAFKLRQGMPIGVSVTLRGRRMYEFLDRLMNASLPRVRDFRGVPRDSFDGRGNYSLGITEQVIFPEIDYNSIDKLRGLQVVIVTTARTDREGQRMLELLGMPFERSQSEAAA